MSRIYINNCKIIDGTGHSAYKGGLLLSQGKIEKIIPAGEEIIPISADSIIDGEGLTAVPGFIDTHSHNDLAALKDSVIAPKLLQGITSEILGQDGLSLAPATGDLHLWEEYLQGFYGGNLGLKEEFCRNTEEYLSSLSKKQSCANYGYLVPHGNLRYSCMEDPGKRASETDCEKMAELLQEELHRGALGWSTGLIYPPCCFSDQHEMELLSAVSARAGKPLVVHQRSESDDILSSMEELFCIAEKTGVALHLSHFKICGFKNIKLLDQVLEKIESAKARGIRYSMDVYPYVAGSTSMAAMLPPWVKTGTPGSMLKRLGEVSVRKQILRDMEDGIPGWDNFADFAGFHNIFVASVKNESAQEYVGKNLVELGDIKGKSPGEALFDLLIEEENQVSMMDFYTDESVLEAFLIREETNLCTDGLLKGTTHPRAYGSFPRLISRFVREKGLLTMEEAIRKMTGKGAEAFGIEDRGLLKEGNAADLLLIDEARICDKGTFVNPAVHPDGITGIYINGESVVSQGMVGRARPGKIIKK
jgi:N-acyl-D-amino-acid deacylase